MEDWTRAHQVGPVRRLRPLQVLVLLPEDGHLVLEEDGVQAELGVDQRHVAEPAGERVDALLPLGEVLRVGPGGALCALGGRDASETFRQPVHVQEDVPEEAGLPCTASSEPL